MLFNYRSKVIEKQKKVEEQIGKIRNDDPNLNSWRNLIELTSDEEKKKFEDSIGQAVFRQDELDKCQSLEQGKTQKRKHGTRGKTAYTILIEKIVKELMESNESVPQTKEVIQAIENREFDPNEEIFQEEKKGFFYFNNPKTRKEYSPVKLKSIKNRIAEILSCYK